MLTPDRARLTRYGATGCPHVHNQQEPAIEKVHWVAPLDAYAARRVEEDPKRRAGLVVMLGRPMVEHRSLRDVEVVDDHVEVHLLGSSWRATAASGSPPPA